HILSYIIFVFLLRIIFFLAWIYYCITFLSTLLDLKHFKSTSGFLLIFGIFWLISCLEIISLKRYHKWVSYFYTFTILITFSLCLILINNREKAILIKDGLGAFN